MTVGKTTIVTYLLLAAGLVLALLSWTDLCSFGGCTEAHEYRFYGISLPLLGTVYFICLLLLRVAAGRFAPCQELFMVSLAGGAGAEGVMIHLQKYVINAWCPLCLGIAFVLFVLLVITVISVVYGKRGLSSMNRRGFFSRVLILAVAAAAGFAVSFAGIKKPEAAGMDATLGRQSAKMEIYFFSDWLCPICIKTEPVIDAIYPQLEKRAKIYFIDKPVHKESMNFVPYHLSFLVHEKGKYLQLRKALFDLAKINKNPTLEDVKRAIAPLGVTYKQLSFMDVSQMMAKSQALSNEYKVAGTPTLVIRNGARSKTLVGGRDITAENILKTMKSLE
jgi:protein-disulfide isomerase/uncharacterized membrane protein